MFAPTKKSFAVITVISAIAFGAVGVDAAFASTSLVVSPSTDLVADQEVTVTLDGFAPDALASAQVAQCGNAYADGTPLPAMPSPAPGLLDKKNCEVIGFMNPGAFTAAPAVLSGPAVTARQAGIGTGNRSCIAVPTAIAPCFVYVSTKVNLPDDFPTVPITFASPPDFAVPAETSTTVTPIGAPIAVGKDAHVLVTVTTVDPTQAPDEQVSVYEGATLLGTGQLSADGTADVAIGSLGLGSHAITAIYDGNGSFASSQTESPVDVEVIAARNITIGDTTIVEGDAGVRSLVFPVVLSQSPGAPLSMTYTVVGSGTDAATVGASTASGTEVATPTNTSASKTLKFKDAQTVKYITVKTIGDTVLEEDETFSIVLSNLTGPADFVFRKEVGLGTIQDDDATAKPGALVDLGSGSVPEGDAGGARMLKVTVTLSAALATPVTLYVQTTSIDAIRGSKKTGDWGGPILRRVVIRAGTTSKVFGMPAFPDTAHELDRTVRYKIQSVVGASAGPRSETFGTILSDE